MRLGFLHELCAAQFACIFASSIEFILQIDIDGDR